MLSLLKYEIYSRWTAALGMGIGLSLFSATYIYLFPEVGRQVSPLADLSIYQMLGFDMGSFEGYIGSTIVLFLPIWLGIYVIITSTQTLAGEEDQGTLELLLTMPLHRWQIVSAKTIAIGLAVFSSLVIAALGSGFALNGIRTRVEVTITSQQLILAVMNAWPLTMVFVMMGLFLGAFLPNRRMAATTLTVIFIVSYLGENLASQIALLSPLKPYSLFTYFDSSSDVFHRGVRAEDVLVLLGVASAFFGLALLSFQRRNVTVGAWPWQRARKSG